MNGAYKANERGIIMFGLYFGNYLVEKNKISQSQLDNLLQQHHNARAKLGLIAVSEKLITAKQAEEINDIQKRMDQRFGDIAIEKGYLLEEEVTYLLNQQGNSYLRFVQLFTDQGILSIHELETLLEEYKKDNNLSDLELEALKSGDIDRIIPIFVDADRPIFGDSASLTIRNIIRFINPDVMLKRANKAKNYSYDYLASQQLIGDYNIFLGLSGSEKAMLQIAAPFAKERFETMEEDAFDSVCEFINCTVGLYASKLSTEDIELDMSPPSYDTKGILTSEGDIYIVPLLLGGEQADIVIVVNDSVVIN
jgi:CheY-specific phosphatase CheX